MNLSTKLKELSLKLATTREGFWGLGWQIAQIIECYIPHKLIQTKIIRLVHGVERHFRPGMKVLEGTPNITITEGIYSQDLDSITGKPLFKDSAAAEYRITLDLISEADDQPKLTYKELKGLVNELISFFNQHQLNIIQTKRESEPPLGITHNQLGYRVRLKANKLVPLEAAETLLNEY